MIRYNFKIVVTVEPRETADDVRKFVDEVRNSGMLNSRDNEEGRMIRVDHVELRESD